jgi:acyl carrier protein
VLEVVTELEERFDISIPAVTASSGLTARTVADVVAQVSALVEGRQRV